MKLFTIGDSLSQGFMSGAAGRTDLSYSTLIAKAMGLNPGSSSQTGTNYYFPEWKNGGILLNTELVLRRLNERYGVAIRGIDWLSFLYNVNRVIDDSEDYYERGEGSADHKYHGNVSHFHNVSSWSFDVADSWKVTPEVCIKKIKEQRSIDGFLTIANASFYRTALKVLSPNLDFNFSQLDWLKYHCQTEGVETLVLWLGSNNALKSMLTFNFKETPNDPENRPHLLSHLERRKKQWNLWHPEDFKAEYEELLTRVHRIMSTCNKAKNWKIFIGTVPFTTIVPLLKGIGPKIEVPGKGIYYQNYTFLPLSEKVAMKQKLLIPFTRALEIDNYIQKYNESIKELIEEKNEKLRQASPDTQNGYYLVDLCDAFSQMDYRRNNGKPTYKFPKYFNTIKHKVNSNFYHVSPSGEFMDGGLFGLDGVHPSAIGHGLIANEFMKVMKEAGVRFKHTLNWKEIFKSDTLYQKPITLMQGIYKHELLSAYFIKFMQKYIQKM